MGSVVYILMLLLLVVYIFSILGTLIFGFNDPAHFGNVAISMLTLFQVHYYCRVLWPWFEPVATRILPPSLTCFHLYLCLLVVY
jgi:hypothetical protein